MEPKITCICGSNKYKDSLIYNIVYEYNKTGLYKFGAIIGGIYPYYKYFSDNMYIKYDEETMNVYLENLIKIYKKYNGNMENNLLIIDTNLIDLNTKSWKYLLENYKIYKTDIIITIDKLMDCNIKQLGKYVNILHLLKQTFINYNYIDKVYETFFETFFQKETFKQMYCECTANFLNIMICDLDNITISKYEINLTLPLCIFNTYKMYDQNKIYKQRCVLSDIINV